MTKKKLNEAEVQERLEKFPEWSLKDGKLYREYAFGDFVDAFGFMSSAALVSESLNHHPEWCNVYNKVRVHLSTHDVDGISELDFEWITKTEKLFARYT